MTIGDRPSLHDDLNDAVQSLQKTKTVFEEAFCSVEELARKLNPDSKEATALREVRFHLSKLNELLTKIESESERVRREVELREARARREARAKEAREARKRRNHWFALAGTFCAVASLVVAVLAWRLPVDPAGRKESVAEDAAPPRGTAAGTASGSPPQVPSSVEAVPSASAAPSTTPPPVTDTLCVIDASGGAGSRPRILRAEELCGYLQRPGEPALSCSEQQLDYGRLRARFVEGIPTHFISNGHPRVLDVLRARVSGSTLWSYVKLAEQSQIRKWSHSVEVKNLCSDRAALVIGSEFKVASLGLRP